MVINRRERIPVYSASDQKRKEREKQTIRNYEEGKKVRKK
jgi:hypothetical protein